MSRVLFHRAQPSTAPAPGHWPFTPSRSFAGALRRMMLAAEGLSLLGWEASCRVTPGQACAERLLLGFATHGVAPSRLLDLPRSLAMPSDWATDFVRELPLASRVLLAVEGGARGTHLKAYLEADASAVAGDKALHKALNPDLPPAESCDWPVGLALRGRKWRVGGLPASRAGTSARTSDYWSQALQVPDLLTLLRAPEAWPATTGPACALVLTALQAGLSRQPKGWACAVLTVSELPSLRASLCICFHDTGLLLGDLTPALARLARAWSLPETSLTHLPGSRRLGWLALGVDGAGLPFLTVYSDACLADARLALALGAFS